MYGPVVISEMQTVNQLFVIVVPSNNNKPTDEFVVLAADKVTLYTAPTSSSLPLEKISIEQLMKLPGARQIVLDKTILVNGLPKSP